MNTAWRWLRAPLLVVAAAVVSPGCNTERSEGESCKSGGDCASGLLCMEKVCRRPCNVDADCRALAPQCRDGVCKPETPTLCGNGRIDGDEACDSGAANSNAWTLAQHCNARCTAFGPYCGDGLTDTPHEACDDGNQSNTDDCPDGVGGTCQSARCGDGLLWANHEVCDEGAANSDGWGPSQHCNATCTAMAPEYCGDGVVQAAHEQCDDGNSASGDGCAACSLEQGWKCHSQMPLCFIVADGCADRADFTFCDVATSPDRSYDICVGGACVSPGCGDASCNTPGPSFTLADTNQRLCYDATAETACPDMSSCASTAFCGQDAQYGWDTAHAASERYTKTEPVAGRPVVLDRVTGLVWQGCPAGQSGTVCADADGSPDSYTWEQALAYCDGLSWGGYVDWHLPDSYELRSLVDYGRHGPAIDISTFPQTPSTWFWSSSSYVGSPSDAWLVHFDCGHVSNANRSSVYSVRCVRRGPYARAERFIRSEPVSGQPVVKDNVTGLVWQGCAAGMTGSTCTGTETTHAWQQALQYCQSLDWGGHQDWYLPDVKELTSIADMRRTSPAVDIAAFPRTPGTWFWSSSSYAGGPSFAWGVNFSSGYVGNVVKSSNFSVRCVRRGP